MTKLSLALCAFLLVAAVTACSAGKSSPLGDASGSEPASGPAEISLPVPAELARQVSEETMDSDRFVRGGYSYSVLPTSRYTVEGMFFETGAFSPAYSEPDNTAISNAAYSGYVLANMTEYSGPAQIQTG